MSLTNALNIGSSALAASQIAIQVTGHNLANINTPGYTRQVARLHSIPGSQHAVGVYTGRGVLVRDVQRQINAALEARLQDSVSREQRAAAEYGVLGEIESLMNELTGVDLSSQLNKFFNAFSEFANNPAATETRAVVVEQGATLASYIRALSQDLTTQQRGVDQQIATHVERADELLEEIASLNESIVRSERGQGDANDLRDRRDLLIRELSGLIDVSTVEQPSGVIDVFVGSTPLVLAGDSRGIEFRRETVDGEIAIRVQVRDDGERLRIQQGSIGGLLAQRDGDLQKTITELDQLASALIHEVNRLHSSGQAALPLTDLTGWLRTAGADQTLALNDPANTTFAGLPASPRGGSFTVVVRDSSGAEVRTRIDIDLDGIDATGAAGFGDDTSLEDIRAALAAVPNLDAEITAGGQLRVFSDSGFDFNFENDTSGVLATLGINTYFTGTGADDIAVRQDLLNEPLLLVSGLSQGTNETAIGIAGLRDKGITSLGGLTLENAWLKTVERVGVAAAGAGTRVEATRLVRENLDAHRAGVSGVSADEESINLLNYQRQYQAAARFITVVDEMMQTLLALV